MLLVVEALDEGYLAVTLNRPTSTAAFLEGGDGARRRISYGGDGELNAGAPAAALAPAPPPDTAPPRSARPQARSSTSRRLSRRQGPAWSWGSMGMG